MDNEPNNNEAVIPEVTPAEVPEVEKKHGIFNRKRTTENPEDKSGDEPEDGKDDEEKPPTPAAPVIPVDSKKNQPKEKTKEVHTKVGFNPEEDDFGAASWGLVSRVTTKKYIHKTYALAIDGVGVVFKAVDIDAKTKDIVHSNMTFAENASIDWVNPKNPRFTKIR